MIDRIVGVGRRRWSLTVVVCTTPVLELYNALVQLIVRVLPEGLVRRILLLILVDARQVRLISSAHLRVSLVGRGRLRRCSFLRLRCYVTDAAHSALKANVIHFVHWLARLLDYAEVSILVHGRYLSLEAVHEVRGLRRLPRRLVEGGCRAARLRNLARKFLCVHRVPRVVFRHRVLPWYV